MASFLKRGNTWSYRVSFSTPDGKRKFVNKGGFKTKHAAQAAARIIEGEKDSGLVTPTTTKPFAVYFKDWYDLYIMPTAAANTKRVYTVFLGILRQHPIGDYPLNTITPSVYQEFINEYGAHHSKSTMVQLNAKLRSSVKHATYDGLIVRDFTHNVKLVYDKSLSRPVVWLNASQLKTITTDLLDTIPLSSRPLSRYMILTSLLTGMRIGEVMALCWEDIDFSARTISINKSWNREKSIAGPTKTESSVRTIQVNTLLLDQLSNLNQLQRVANNINPETQVFLNANHAINGDRTINLQLHRVLKECSIEIPGFHFHSLRHTHASYLLYQGVSAFAISKRLGHRNVQTTLNVYSHIISEMQTKETNKIMASLDSIIK